MSNLLQEIEAQIAGVKTSVTKQNVGTDGPTATIPFDHFVGLVYAGPPRLYGLRVTFAF